MWIGIIKLHHSKCSVPSRSWNYCWNYCLPTTVFQVFRKNRSLFLQSLSQAAARSIRAQSKAYSYAAVCSWNTHTGVTPGSPSAQVLLIQRSKSGLSLFLLHAPTNLRSEQIICWAWLEVDQEACLGFFLPFSPSPLRSVIYKCSCAVLVLPWTSFCVSLWPQKLDRSWKCMCFYLVCVYINIYFIRIRGWEEEMHFKSVRETLWSVKT